MSSLEIKIDETEKIFKETSKVSEDRLKKTVEAEAKIVHLSQAMQRYLDSSNFIFLLLSDNILSLFKQARRKTI